MSLFDNIEDQEDDDIFAAPPKPAKKRQKDLFDNLEESEDFVEKVSDDTRKSSGREVTPEFFHEVQQDSQMSLFSPGKPKPDDLFQFKEEEEKTEPATDVEEQKAPKKTDMFGDPVSDDEDTKQEPEVEESFEMIDSGDVPSPEEAERELEAIAREQERLKAEREKEKLEETQEEPDGGAFSRAVREEEPVDDDEPPPLPASDVPTNVPSTDVPSTNVPSTDVSSADVPSTDVSSTDVSSTDVPSTDATNEAPTSNDEKVLQAEKALLEAVDEIEALTMKLNQAQEEVDSLFSQVEFFRDQWNSEKDKVADLEAKLKEKDDQIAALKEAATKSSKPPLSKRPSSTSVASGTKPAPATAKPTTKPTSATTKPPAAKPTPASSTSTSSKPKASSPKTSAKLRSDESRRGQPSVAEAVKKFGGSQEVPKKPSPTIRRSSKASEPADKAATQKSSPRSTTKRKDSSSEKKEDKKVSSPPKPPRNRVPVDESDSQPNMNGSGGNALDAIKMWENKTAGIVDSNPPSKKPLSVQKSSPVISSSKVEEEERSAKESSVEKEEVNGTEDTPVVEDKENKEKDADDGVSMRQSHSVGNVSRNFKSMSVVEPGTKPVSSTGKRGFTPAAIEKCFACKKTVYTVEKLKADDKVYHKNCFKCSYCKKVVGTGTYAANKGEIFCKTHFKMLFKIKGNYDEGFGREQHKKKWGSGAQGAEQAAE